MKIGLITDPTNRMCYNSINYFINNIEKALNYWGIHTQKFSIINEDILTDSWDAIICINSNVPSAKMSENLFYMDLLDCPVFDILVDPPWFHHSILESHMENLYLIVLDQGHVEYCRQYYSPLKNVEMGYLLGPGGSSKNYNEKEIDVLFLGTYEDVEGARNVSELSKLEHGNVFYDLLIQVRINHPEMSTLQSLKFLLDRYNIEYSDSLFKLLMNICGAQSDFYMRGYYRKRILTTLIDAGITVHVAGAGWENLYSSCPGNLILEGAVDFSQTANLMENSKIILNIMPWKDGIHDRILASMLNGAVCVTNSSSYIDSHFQNGKDIVLFDICNPEMLPSQISELLENPARAESIAEAGYQKVSGEYTWEQFAQKYILKYLF